MLLGLLIQLPLLLFSLARVVRASFFAVPLWRQLKVTDAYFRYAELPISCAAKRTLRYC